MSTSPLTSIPKPSYEAESSLSFKIKFYSWISDKIKSYLMCITEVL